MNRFLKLFSMSFRIRNYIIIGSVNSLFAYSSSVILYLILERYVYDVALFSLCSVINITVSYFTMTLFVFHNRQGISLRNYSMYVLASLASSVLSIFLSVILIRSGFSIFVTQLFSIFFGLILQLMINVLFLTKRQAKRETNNY